MSEPEAKSTIYSRLLSSQAVSDFNMRRALVPSLSRPPSPALPPLPSNLAFPTLLCLHQEDRSVQQTAELVLPAPASRAHVRGTSAISYRREALGCQGCVVGLCGFRE